MKFIKNLSCLKTQLGNSAQGTIEYLVILAVILIIALLAVLLLPGIVDFSSLSNQSNTLNLKVGNELVVEEVIYDSNIGNILGQAGFLISLKNISQGTIKITAISAKLGDKTVLTSYSSANSLSLSGSKLFLVKGDFDYLCNSGKNVSSTLTLYYENDKYIPMVQSVSSSSIACSDFRPTEFSIANITNDPAGYDSLYLSLDEYSTIKLPDVLLNHNLKEILINFPNDSNILNSNGVAICTLTGGEWLPISPATKDENCTYMQLGYSIVVPDQQLDQNAQVLIPTDTSISLATCNDLNIMKINPTKNFILTDSFSCASNSGIFPIANYSGTLNGNGKMITLASDSFNSTTIGGQAYNVMFSNFSGQIDNLNLDAIDGIEYFGVGSGESC
ncbi:MAG: hypothetical protein PHQ98_04270, partial [Candidatus ainarchaeum sp.]|nr:hypothetical protein [Candidatus ainarchaeum sp.]